ncbi:flagellum-associated coiled-coil domain-containing protein 1 [Petromyzon marinus]|uniref:Centrosomal protein of 83 kDa-like n=1 Tax=Petromyzon marinus TaxID=7757 RepID=A0AAJ7TEN9_PETMA|nr:centrosomal protein of 83 kDa-like [Petromyzon marinus]
MEEMVAELQQQISLLSLMVQEERRKHHKEQDDLKQEMELRLIQLKTQHEHELGDIQKQHGLAVAALEAQQLHNVKEQKSRDKDCYNKLKEKHEFLESSFEAYKDSVRAEMSECWAQREAELFRKWEAGLSDSDAGPCGIKL